MPKYVCTWPFNRSAPNEIRPHHFVPQTYNAITRSACYVYMQQTSMLFTAQTHGDTFAPTAKLHLIVTNPVMLGSARRVADICHAPWTHTKKNYLDLSPSKIRVAHKTTTTTLYDKWHGKRDTSKVWEKPFPATHTTANGYSEHVCSYIHSHTRIVCAHMWFSDRVSKFNIHCVQMRDFGGEMVGVWQKYIQCGIEMAYRSVDGSWVMRTKSTFSASILHMCE